MPRPSGSQPTQVSPKSWGTGPEEAHCRKRHPTASLKEVGSGGSRTLSQQGAQESTRLEETRCRSPLLCRSTHVPRRLHLSEVWAP